MVTRSSKDTKLVVLPGRLVERLKEIAVRRGVSVSGFAAGALEQAVRAEEMEASLEEAVDVFGIFETIRGSGAVQIPRSKFNSLISELHRSNRDELLAAWEKVGRWYGEYLYARLGEGALGFLEKALLVSWNLDEVEIHNEGLIVNLRFTSFIMAFELTELLVSYISGIMNALGFEAIEKSYLRGLATLSFRKVPSAHGFTVS
ncbi:MAG: hypothetical protein ACETVY_00725 [Candidatus Bathyarchaeia archaeon]